MAWFDKITLCEDTTTEMLELLLNSKFDWRRISKLVLHDTQADDDILCQFLARLTNVSRVVIDTMNMWAAGTRTLIIAANKLQHVRLIGYAQTNDVMRLLGEHQNNLEGLHIARCDCISAASIAAYLKSAHNLRDFCCTSNVTDDVLNALR